MHWVHRVRPIAANGVAWYECLSVCVCVCVCWSRSWALQKRLNRSRCRLEGRLGWAQTTIIIGVEITDGKGHLLVVRPFEKLWESVLQQFTQQKINNGGRAAGCNAPDLSMLHNITHPSSLYKSTSLRCGLSTYVFSRLKDSNWKNQIWQRGGKAACK